MENNQNVKDFYKNKIKEEEREGRETLEFTRSKIIIRRHLSESIMDIADVGGATGAYSFWLAGMGHRVHLLDLADNHIDIAKQKSQDNGILLASYSCADARELPYKKESMDMVLLMGALYHFRLKESRMKCISEAYRVLRNGGVFICTVINRYNYLIAPMKYTHLIESMGLEPIEEALATGISDNPNFSLPLSYTYTPSEITTDLIESGFTNNKLIAVEGIANAISNNQLPENKGEAARLLRCIELAESVPELVGVSRNIIAVGSK